MMVLYFYFNWATKGIFLLVYFK